MNRLGRSGKKGVPGVSREERRNIMRTFATAILLGGALLMGATGAMAQSNNNSYDNWREQVSKLKTGRYTPAEEARLKEEAASTAYREEAASQTTAPANAWFEQIFKERTGRNTPAEEARQKEEAANSAFREDFTTGSAPALPSTWHGQLFRAKYGRPCPLEASPNGK
jgi:hypothetical protein